MEIYTNNPARSDENSIVWHKTIINKEIFLKKYANFIYPPYIEGFHRLGLNANQLPTVELLTKVLSPTGWEPIFVQGYVSAKAYINLLSKKKIPISTDVRSFQHIQYAPEPDLIHDIIGHLPMLFFKDYVDYLMDFCECFLEAEHNIYDDNVSQIQKKIFLLHRDPKNEKEIAFAKKEFIQAEKAQRENPSRQYQLGRIFLWTIEFGLIKNHSIPKLYGAGLMSSSLEAEEICQGRIKILPFSLDEITKVFHYSDLQDQVFVANSFQSLRKSIARFKNTIIA